MTIKKNIYWRFIARRIVQHSSIHYVSKEEEELCHKFHQFKNIDDNKLEQIKLLVLTERLMMITSLMKTIMK